MQSIAEVTERWEQSAPPPVSTTTCPSNDSTRQSGPTNRCPLCDGIGWLRTGRGAVPCECQSERRIVSALPPRYRSARLADFSSSLREKAGAWLSNPGDGLLLAGPVGTGKTHLAAAILRGWAQAGKSRTFAFRRCADLYAALRETYRTGASEGSVLRDYLEAHLLVLDDLGAGSLSDHERRATLEVLDQRLNQCRPTVVTSNWSLAEIAERMDDRIASRLASFHRIELQGVDRRLGRKPAEAVTP